MRIFAKMAVVLLLGMGVLALPACSTVSEVTGAVTAALQPRPNPISRTDLYNIENSVTIAVTGLVAYRRACLRGQADANCRANIEKLQVYTRKMPPALASLRKFVKENNQVSAVTAYNALKDLVAQFTAQRQALGVT